jgi:hypothetical protein
VFEEAYPGASDPWGGLGCIADSYSVSYAQGDGFTPIGLAALPNSAPVGYLDYAGCDDIRGWAEDSDTPDSALAVDVYANAPAGDPSSIFVGSVTADVHREDLCQAIGSCNHGYSMTTPLALKDGADHALFVYAHDSADGTPALLSSGIAPVNCAAPPLGEPPQKPIMHLGPFPAGTAPTASPGAADAVSEDSGEQSGCAIAGASRGSAPATSMAWVLVGLCALARRRRARRAR